MGRLVAELLINENANVTVTLRERKKGVIQIPKGAETISYNERYKAIERADIVVSATASPHFTLCYKELSHLTWLPSIMVDLAVPRDIEPSVNEISGLTLLTIDDISGESRVLLPESILMIDGIIREHIKKYHHWLTFKREKAA
jgi:glutamyl-tRNA reductase